MKTPTTKQELKDHIEELIKKVDAMPDDTPDEVDYAVWWPGDGERYWFGGRVCGRGLDPHKPATIEHSRQSTCGIFKTKEDDATYTKVDNRYYELMDGVVLDWSDISQLKYFFEWDHVKNEADQDYDTNFQTQGAKHMTEKVMRLIREEFTNAEFKLWLLGGARR